MLVSSRGGAVAGPRSSNRAPWTGIASRQLLSRRRRPAPDVVRLDDDRQPLTVVRLSLGARRIDAVSPAGHARVPLAGSAPEANYHDQKNNKTYRGVIVPLSLGGTAVIEKGSCARCEKITSYLDGYLARDIFNEYRSHVGTRQVFAGGASDIQNGVDFFWQVRGDKLKPAQIERVLKFWEAALAWAQAEPGSSDVPLSPIESLSCGSISTLDDRAKLLLRPVVAHVHSDYSTDQMIEELARLSESDPAGTVELLETMFAERTPVFDMDDKLKGLLKKLYLQGHQTEVLRT